MCVSVDDADAGAEVAVVVSSVFFRLLSSSSLRLPGLLRVDGRGLAGLEMVDVPGYFIFLVATLASECKAWCLPELSFAGLKNVGAMVVIPRGAVATCTAEDQRATVQVGPRLVLVPIQVFSEGESLLTAPYVADKLLVVKFGVFTGPVSNVGRMRDP